MSQFARIVTGFLLLASLGACTTSPEAPPEGQEVFFRQDTDYESGMWQFTHYLSDVGNDFLDIFQVSGGIGKAGPALFFGNVHLTKYAEAGFGNWTGYSAGMLGRSFGVWREERDESGFSLLLIQNYSVQSIRIPTWGTNTLRERGMDAHGYNIDLDENGHWADLGGSVYVLALGVDVGVSPFEFFDFFGGLLGNYPVANVSGDQMPWSIGRDLADDDTRVSVYNDKIGRYRSNPYSCWPTIWPTTYTHQQVEGEGWTQLEAARGGDDQNWRGSK